MNLSNDNYSTEQFISFLEKLEKKFQSFENVQENVFQLINVLSNTHQQIIQDFLFLKSFLTQLQLSQQRQQQQQQQQSIEIDENQSQSDEDFQMKSERNFDESDDKIDRSSFNSPLSLISTSTNSFNQAKHSSNLKKSTRIKSPKSVSFSFDENHQSKQNSTTNEDHIPQQVDLIPHLFQQHHQHVTHKTDIGYQLGNGLTNIRIHEIEPTNGEYLRLLNISNSDDYDLSGHYLQQNLSCVPFSRFKFPLNTILRAGQTITIWCGPLRDIEAQPPHVFLWKEQRRWETGPECVTVLAKPTGQAIAWARSSNRINSQQSSSDILFVHSKSHQTLSDVSIPSKNRHCNSSYQFIGNHRSPFAHSPSSPIHPDHNPSPTQIGQSQLLNRPKSSPFSNHFGCRKDLITMNYLKNEQKRENTTIET